MNEIIIIEESFLVRFAIKKLILEIDERYGLHELTKFAELKGFAENMDSAVIIVDQDLLPADYQKFLKKLNLHHPRIVKISCSRKTASDSDEVIFLGDTGTSVLKKLKEVLDQDTQTGKPLNAKTLTDRETDVLKCVALGMTNKEIAERLYLSTHTVITHRKNISSKLGIRTIAGFAVYALLNKIILPDDINK